MPSVLFPSPAGLAGEIVTQVACGNRHSLAITAGGRLFAFGLNNEGQCDPPGVAVDALRSARRAFGQAQGAWDAAEQKVGAA